MMEIISPTTDVAQAFNSIPLRFNMREPNKHEQDQAQGQHARSSSRSRSRSRSPSPSPPGLERAHHPIEAESEHRATSISGSSSPGRYPKASSVSTLPYPSPPVLPPLDLSSVPTSPVKEDGNRTETTRRQIRPASVELVPSALARTVRSPSDAVQLSRPSSHHSKNTNMLSSSLRTDEEIRSSPSSECRIDTSSKTDAVGVTTTSSMTSTATSTALTDPQLMDWTQMLQNFAAFCQGKVKLPSLTEQDPSGGESSAKKTRSDCDYMTEATKPPQFTDPLSQFQAMFLSMGQMLFNSQTTLPPISSALGLSSKSGVEEENEVSETNKLSSAPAVSEPVTPTYPSNGDHVTDSPELASGLSVPIMTSLIPTPTAAPAPLPGGADFPVPPQSSLAFTASLLAMLAAQNSNSGTTTTNSATNKSMHPQHPSHETMIPFGPTGNLILPNPFTSGSTTPNNSNNNSFPARVPPVFPNGFANPNNHVPFFPALIPSNKLPDNRELLYQLGQQLMAMAAASGTPSDLGSKPMGLWSSHNVNPTTSNSNTNNNSSTMEAHPMTGFPSFPLPSPAMAAMMGSSLFGGPQAAFSTMGNPPTGPAPPTQPVPPPSSSSMVRNNDRKSAASHLMSNPSLPGAGNSLSGISMRGNQKYSAYYQHQRKQGFNPQLTADYAATGSNARRQGAGLTTTQLSGARYASRRFRGGSLANATGMPAHAIGLDTRGPGGPRLPGVRGPAVNMFPGFRGSTPYTSSGSVAMTTITTMASNTGGKHILTNGGAPSSSSSSSSKIQTPSDPMQMAAAAACGAASSTTGPINTPTASEPTGNRHRDTAFLCSCGQDFESLYVFTLHMKDTGHKPKSDQSERDIPKLVRGQDMWINSETEQTREILRCMRCHQSFRNLPELTMHMMKTNHYSEIVYNDSGRLVFVNPDDPHHPHSRRGSANSGGASGVSPGKATGVNSSPGHWLSRRGSRGASTSNSSSAVANSSATTSVTNSMDQTPSKSFSPRSGETLTRPKADHLSGPSNESRMTAGISQVKDKDQADRLTSSQSGKTRNSNTSRSDESSETHSPLGTGNHTPIHQTLGQDQVQTSTSTERDSPQSSLSTKPEMTECPDRAECCPMSPTAPNNKIETNVLRQIETFVENNLPRTPKSLTVKVDHVGSSSSSTPSTDASSRYSFGTAGPAMNAITAISESAKSTPSPIDNRKRTHSEASLSIHGSPVPSPSAASDPERGAKHQCLTGDNNTRTPNPSSATGTPPTPVSPGVTSTTSEFSGPLRENPLSSLQKLVETTHKPVPPSAAFSTPNTGSTTSSCFPLTSSCTASSLFVSCTGSGSKTTNTHCATVGGHGASGRLSNSSTGPGSGPRSLSSPMDMAGSPFALNTAAGHSPGSQFAPIMLPASESENLIPALSALYAYVEKSSSTPSSAPSSLSSASSVSAVHSHDRNTATPGNKPSCVSPNTIDEKIGSSQQSPQSIPSSDKLPPAPALQAIYAAAMSSLAAQYLQQQQQQQQQQHQHQQQQSDPVHSNIDPFEAFKQAASSFKTMLGDSKSDGADANWLKMLQLFTGKLMTKSDSVTDVERNVTGQSQEPPPNVHESGARMTQSTHSTDFGRIQSKTSAQTNSHHINHTGRRQTGELSEDPMQPSTPDAKGSDGMGMHNSPSPSKFNPSPMDSSSYMTSMATSTGPLNSGVIYSNSLNSYHPHVPNLLTGRYPSMQGRSMNTTNPSPAMMTTMITKKAKCHFCGKPFANKGQVRLHISKNKCPCLLQQSCHVAALAAAFGSDNGRPLANTSSNVGPSKSFMKDPLLAGKGRTSAEDFLASLAYTSGGGGGGSSSAGVTPLPPNDSAPSALSLLKERFQNFDLSHNPLRTSSTGTESKANSSTYTTSPGKSVESSDPMFAAVASASYSSSVTGNTLPSQSFLGHGSDAANNNNNNPSAIWSFGPPLPPQTSMSQFSTASDNLTTSSASGANNPNAAAAAAANAGHLAAMALLAQTLVQLTSSQVTNSPYRGAPPISTGPESSFAFTEPAMAAAAAAAAAAMASSQLTSRPITTPTSSSSTTASPITSMPFFSPMSAFNFDLLMNQTALMKQLSAMTSWPDRSDSDDSVSMSNPFLALSNCRNTTPNGTP